MLETVRTGIKGMAVMASRVLGDLWSTGAPLGTGGTQRERSSLQPERGITLGSAKPWLTSPRTSRPQRSSPTNTSIILQLP